MPDLAVIVPCFNEAENVQPLLTLLDKALGGIDWEVIFVDDDSPDGTADVVRAAMSTDARVHLVHRIGRRGLAGACIEGILSSRAKLTAVMDADLQHDETKLVDMFKAFEADPDLDLCIGSRNVEGGSSGDGLSKVRKWGSDLATNFSRWALKISANDPMSGFFMIRRPVFDEIASKLQNQGFKILADMLSLSKGKWKIHEVPYTFRKRQFGESKMDSAIALEFLGLLFARKTGGLVPIRFVLFMMVGATGVLVQYFASLSLILGAGLSLTVATLIGVFVAMTTNFFLNNVLTYRDRALSGRGLIYGLLSFYAVCSLGGLANTSIVYLMYNLLGSYIGATIIGAAVSAIWNFVASSLATWRIR